MNINFNNRTVLVTGGTRGIGYTTSNMLRSMGAEVIITGTGDNINDGRYIKADFSNREGIEKFTNILDEIPKIDACFNCAGINIISTIDDIKIDDFDSVMNVNLYAPFFISKTLIKKMRKQNYGRIVNVSSIWGSITKKGRTSYSVSKNGIIGLTKSLAVEGAPYNIIVNSISPGFTLTELTKKSLSDIEIKELENTIPLGRIATTDEISNISVFLLSEQNSYMTGQNIIADGGFSII